MKRKNISSLTGCISCFLSFILLSASCSQSPAAKKQHDVKTGSADIKYAKGFNIDYYANYKLVSIYSRAGTKTDTIQYVLLAKGVNPPLGYKKSQLITIPLKHMVAMSSMHIALADFASVADIITGLGNLNYVTCPLVRKNIQLGKVKEVGLDGGMNNEMLIAMKPDLVMVMGNPEAKYTKYQTIMNAGIPVMLNSEWLETTPLGRAEWVKLMAALVNKEQLVDGKFSAIADEYNRLAEIGRTASVKPSLICGMPFKGVWYTPDGDSYMAAFMNDAGTTYKWINTRGTGSLMLNFESVAPEALKADFWFNVGAVNSKKDIRAIDARYADFKPFKDNKIYNFNNRINDLGANDYWESGAVNPQLILGDMIKILHPQLLPNHQFVYYKQLN